MRIAGKLASQVLDYITPLLIQALLLKKLTDFVMTIWLMFKKRSLPH